MTTQATPRLERGRLPCPSCQAPLEFDLSALFLGTAIVCTGCGATLQSDTDASQDALVSLRKAQALVQGVRRGGPAS